MRTQESASRAKVLDAGSVVTNRVWRGIPVLRAPARLDLRGVAALAELATSRGAGGPVIFDLGQVVKWSAEGITALYQHHPGTTRNRWALVAPPAGMYAILAGSVGLMFPCLNTATDVLTRPPGPLPHPSAAGQAIRYAHRRFAAEPSSLYTARAWTAEQLDGWNLNQLTHRTVIAVSELIADAMTRNNSEFRLTVYVWRETGGARMLTASVAGPLPRDDPAPTAVTSGLRQAAELVDRLGHYQQYGVAPSRCTWFTIGLPMLTG